MPLVQTSFITAPSKKTVARRQKKATRQKGKFLIDQELKTLEKNPAHVPVRESAPYINV